MIAISVVIPAYNEGKRIVRTISDIVSFWREYPHLVKEVIVVDDGSIDDTVEQVYASKRDAPVRVIRCAENGGKWNAIRMGMADAKSDSILILDADNSASIWELERFDKGVAWYVQNRVPVFGSRFLEQSDVLGKSAVRTVISRGYRWFVRTCYRIATGKSDVDDMQCPFKLVFTEQFELNALQERGFCGDVELAAAITEKVYNHPVQFVHHEGGSIKVSTMVRMALETVHWTWMTKKKKRDKNYTMETNKLYKDVKVNK